MPKVDSGYTKTQFITNWLAVKKQVYWTTCITFLMRRRWKKSSSPNGRADIKLTHADMAYEAPQLHNKQAKMNTLAFSSSQPWFLVPEDSFSTKVSIFLTWWEIQLQGFGLAIDKWRDISREDNIHYRNNSRWRSQIVTSKFINDFICQAFKIHPIANEHCHSYKTVQEKLHTFGTTILSNR